MQLILSLFPGIDLLGHGFEAEGFCVTRGPDLLFGGDVRAFHAPTGKFEGVIAGTPCQQFSKANRTRNIDAGMIMVNEFIRVVQETQPNWFLLENVPEIPDITVPGYAIQRFDLNANECGGKQHRNRHFQFGSREKLILIPQREPPRKNSRPQLAHRTALATEGTKPDRRNWADFCELQGLPPDFNLPGWSLAAKYRAVGNGVNVLVARTIARAIKNATPNPSARLCACNCGRLLNGRRDQKTATATCRKRLEKRRKREINSK